MRLLVISKVPERCFWGALLFCTVYESYRYPFKINQTGTSPTYTDTPVSLQLAKFVVVLLICLIALPYLRRTLLSYKKSLLAVAVVCLSIYSLFKAVTAQSGNTTYVDSAFWSLAVLILVLSTRAIDMSDLNRYFRFVFFFALASNAIEILLFVTIRRLPALAYADSFIVRFGAFLDDPNGSAALWYMLMGWSFYHYSGKKRVFVEGILVVCLLLTQSFTAIGYLVLLALAVIFNYAVRRPKPILIIVLGAMLTLFLSFTWSTLVTLASAVIETRRGSVDQHLGQLTTTGEGPALGWLFGNLSYEHFESWWVGSFQNFGLFWYLIEFAVIATLMVAVFKAFRRSANTSDKAVMCGILMFSCYFVFANLNLPLFTVFPINVLFYSFAYLIFFEKIQLSSTNGTATPMESAAV